MPLGYSCGPNIGSMVVVGNTVAIGVAVLIAVTVEASIVFLGMGGGSVALISEPCSEISFVVAVRTNWVAISEFDCSELRLQDTSSMRLQVIKSQVGQVTCEYLSGLAKCIYQYIE